MTELDPELMHWIAEFVHQRTGTTVEDVQRNFFADETDTPRLYLDRLVAARAIRLDHESGLYHWVGRNGQLMGHAYCSHPGTGWERQKCREMRRG